MIGRTIVEVGWGSGQARTFAMDTGMTAEIVKMLTRQAQSGAGSQERAQVAQEKSQMLRKAIDIRKLHEKGGYEILDKGGAGLIE